MAKKDAKKADAKDGMAVLVAPEGCTGCSHDGVSYEVVDGMVEVPAEAVMDLVSHGFST